LRARQTSGDASSGEGFDGEGWATHAGSSVARQRADASGQTLAAWCSDARPGHGLASEWDGVRPRSPVGVTGMEEYEVVAGGLSATTAA